MLSYPTILKVSGVFLKFPSAGISESFHSLEPVIVADT